MKILSRVCAEFFDKDRNVIYRIGPADRLVYKDDAPEALRDDLLFKLLVADGSIEVVETAEQRKRLESNPMAGIDAEGKKIVVEDEPKADAVQKTGTRGKAADPGTAVDEKKK